LVVLVNIEIGHFFVETQDRVGFVQFSHGQSVSDLYGRLTQWNGFRKTVGPPERQTARKTSQKVLQ